MIMFWISERVVPCIARARRVSPTGAFDDDLLVVFVEGDLDLGRVLIFEVALGAVDRDLVAVDLDGHALERSTGFFPTRDIVSFLSGGGLSGLCAAALMQNGGTVGWGR